MKLFGDLDFNQGALKNVLFEALTEFPPSPQPGRTVFKDKRLFLCTDISGTPAWVPLTNEIDLSVHTQSIASTTWDIDYALSSKDVTVQVYDQDEKQIIPDEIDLSVADKIIIGFSVPVEGKAVIVHKSDGAAVAVGGGGSSIESHESALDPHPQYQSDLVSGTNIKTINGESVLGSGDIEISSGGSFHGGFPGAVSPLTGTMRLYPKSNITLVSCVAWLSANAVSTVTATVRVNGSIIATVTVPAGQSIGAAVPLAVAVTTSDYLTIDSVGGSGSDLVVRIDY